MAVLKPMLVKASRNASVSRKARQKRNILSRSPSFFIPDAGSGTKASFHESMQRDVDPRNVVLRVRRNPRCIAAYFNQLRAVMVEGVMRCTFRRDGSLFYEPDGRTWSDWVELSAMIRSRNFLSSHFADSASRIWFPTNLRVPPVS